MEVEEYLGRSRLYRRLRSGPHGQLVERYAARLVEERLVRLGTWRCLNVVDGLLGTLILSRHTRACARVHERVAEGKIVLPDRCVRETPRGPIAPIDLFTTCWFTTTS